MVNFTEACGMVGDGKKIRRHCWGNTDFFVRDNFHVLERDDYDGNDWEEFVPQEKAE